MARTSSSPGRMPGPSPVRSPIDLGTPQRHHHNKASPQLTGRGREFRLKIVDGCAIDRLLLADRITPDQYQVLDRLSEDMFKAELAGLKASDFQPRVSSGSGQDIAHDVALRRARVNEIIRHLDDDAGRGVRMLLISTCLDEHDPPRSRDRELAIGIESLIGYYG